MVVRGLFKEYYHFWMFFFFVFFSLENLAFRLPWPPIKISDLDKIHMVGRGLLQKHFSKTFVKISAVTQKWMPIPTFPIISVWKLFKSCHSNESTLATTKNAIYVEANVMNIYAKFQLQPPYGFWEEDFYIFFFFKILAFRLPWQPIISAISTKFIWLVKDYSRTISVNFFQNICSNTEINAKFHFSHYKSMETLSCHSNESTWAITIKKTQFM